MTNSFPTRRSSDLDPHVMAGQQPLDRAAQQFRIMARHRRDDQQLGRVFGALMLEMLELAKGLARLDRLCNAYRLPVDDGFIQLEPRLAARCRRMCKDFECRGEHRAAAEIAERIRRMLHHLRARRRSEEHTSELQSLMRISYAVFCLKK